jgi:hypothetical protein
MANWSKSTKILVFVIILAVIIVVVLLFVRSKQAPLQPDPQAVLSELTLGEVSSPDKVVLPDPQLDAAVSYGYRYCKIKARNN